MEKENINCNCHHHEDNHEHCHHEHNHEHCHHEDNHEHCHHEHNHEHNHEHCHCHNHDHMDEEEIQVVYLELDDGSKVESGVLGIFPYDGKNYIALVSLDENETIYIYELANFDEDSEELNLLKIEDDETYDKVVEELAELFDMEIIDEE